jgi:hypothetical protein
LAKNPWILPPGVAWTWLSCICSPWGKKNGMVSRPYQTIKAFLSSPALGRINNARQALMTSALSHHKYVKAMYVHKWIRTLKKILIFLKRLPGVGSKPGSSRFNLFSHFSPLNRWATAAPQEKILINLLEASLSYNWSNQGDQMCVDKTPIMWPNPFFS